MRRSAGSVRSGLIFVVVLAAAATAAFFAARAVLAPNEDDPDAAEPPPAGELERGYRFEEVRSASRDVYETFAGKLAASSIQEIRAPLGQRTPILKVVKDQGDRVKKGDVVVVFDGEGTKKQIEQARAKGDMEAVRRGEEWLKNLELRSPFDGIVYDVERIEGEIPIDVGIAVMKIADASSFAVRIQLPQALTGTVAHLGARVTVDLEANLGTTQGTVTAIEPAPEGHVVVVIALDPKEGYEENLGASVRVPTSKQEVALVPKRAVVNRQSVKVVRVWEPDDRMVGERTIQTDGEQGDDWIVVAGVFPGEQIVVPDSR